MKFILTTAIEATQRLSAVAIASASSASETHASAPEGDSSPPRSPVFAELNNILAKRYDVFYFVMATNCIALFGTLGKFLHDSSEDPGDKW